MDPRKAPMHLLQPFHPRVEDKMRIPPPLWPMAWLDRREWWEPAETWMDDREGRRRRRRRDGRESPNRAFQTLLSMGESTIDPTVLWQEGRMTMAEEMQEPKPENVVLAPPVEEAEPERGGEEEEDEEDEEDEGEEAERHGRRRQAEEGDEGDEGGDIPARTLRRRERNRLAARRSREKRLQHQRNLAAENEFLRSHYESLLEAMEELEKENARLKKLLAEK